MQKELLREILKNHKYPEVVSSDGVVPEEAHFNLKEVELLNSLQGHEVRLPDHGNIRSFMPLADLFSDPTYLRLVRQIIENLNEHQVDDNEIEYAVDEFTEENKDKTTVQPESPLATIKAAEGMGGDTEICLCPSNMLDFFDEIRGFSSVNPIDGKRQYFLPILGAIGGALLGSSFLGPALGGTLGLLSGPISTAIGAGLGSKLMGAKTKDALKYAALGGIGNVIAPGVSSALGSVAPGISGALGSITGLGAAGATGAGTAAGATGAGLGAAGTGLSAGTAAGAGLGAASAAGTGLGTMFTPQVLIPTALMGGMLYKAHKDNMKLQEKYNKEMNQYKQDINAFNQRHDQTLTGLKDYFSNIDVSAHKEPQRDYITSNQDKIGVSHGISPMYGFKTGQYYAEGGQIQDKSGGIIGDGKGQQDNIHDDYNVGDYIMPADVTSGLGDGHSDAGYDELDKLKNYIYKTKDVNKAYQKVPVQVKMELTKKQPVAVSPGEYRFDKNITVAIGDGNLKKADRIFQEFYKLVRNDKRTSGNIIPKKAKSAIEYFKDAQRKVEKNKR
jgi:hypothetical protein